MLTSKFIIIDFLNSNPYYHPNSTWILIKYQILNPNEIGPAKSEPVSLFEFDSKNKSLLWFKSELN